MYSSYKGLPPYHPRLYPPGRMPQEVKHYQSNIPFVFGTSLCLFIYSKAFFVHATGKCLNKDFSLRTGCIYFKERNCFNVPSMYVLECKTKQRTCCNKAFADLCVTTKNEPCNTFYCFYPPHC